MFNKILHVIKEVEDKKARKYLALAVRRILEVKLQEYAPGQNSKVTKCEIDLAVNDGKISAIKEVRSRTGLGLKEAKDLIEREMQKRNLKFAGYC